MRRARDGEAAGLIGEQRRDGIGECARVADGHSDRRVGRPLVHVADVGAYRRHAGERGLEDGHRASLVPRGVHEQIALFHELPQRLATEQAVPVHDVVQGTRGYALARGTVRRVESRDVQLEPHAALAQQRRRSEEHGLVLHRPQVGNMQKPRGTHRIAHARGARGPFLERDAERHQPGIDPERRCHAVHVGRADGDALRARDDESRLDASPRAEPRTIADLGQAHELSAGEVREQGKPEPGRGGKRVQRGAAEECVHEVERRDPMLTREEPVKAQPSRPDGPDVVHRRAEERPVARPRLLRQREHVDVVPPRQSLDQPEEGGDDTLRPALVHATGRHDR